VIFEDKLTDIIDVMLLSHFHLDHCGALPYMTEIVGYDGPILMTAPTRAIVPYMLEDFRRVMVETKEFKDRDSKENKEGKDSEGSHKGIFYSPDHVTKCAAKV
jgi:Cft2 family RNA processing exonuclease